jgi:hypothetical protein
MPSWGCSTDVSTYEAEGYTQEALARLADLREQYVEVAEAWAAAESMWFPLANPLRDEIHTSDCTRATGVSGSARSSDARVRLCAG